MIRFVLHAEDSDRTFALLAASGCRPIFVSRGAGGDVVAVPARLAERARVLIAL
jgi:hypothetical protein